MIDYILLLRKKFFFLTFFLCVLQNTFPQDIHFSQFFNSVLYTNPSNTLLPVGYSRFSLQTRNQWLSVTKPYQTYSLSFDNSSGFKKNQYLFLSSGLFFFYDVAGDANFRTIQLSPSIALNFVLPRQPSIILSLALQPNVSQQALNFSKLYFDSQFDGYVFNPSYQSNESNEKYSKTLADVNASFNFLKFFSNESFVSAGCLLAHLNSPKVSMKNNINEIVKLFPKYNAKIDFGFNFNSVGLLPSVYYSKQGPHSEIIFGSRFMSKKEKNKLLNFNTFSRKNLIFGLYYRLRDAYIAYAGVEIFNYSIGVSYDINVSKLTEASRFRGGTEIHISYIWAKRKVQNNNIIVCPLF